MYKVSCTEELRAVRKIGIKCAEEWSNTHRLEVMFESLKARETGTCLVFVYLEKKTRENFQDGGSTKAREKIYEFLSFPQWFPSSLSAHSLTLPFLTFHRNLEEVNRVADAAGLVNRTGPVQVLYSSSTCNTNKYQLLELPPGLLDTLQVGNRYDTCLIYLGVWFHELSEGQFESLLLFLLHKISRNLYIYYLVIFWCEYPQCCY